MKRPDSREIDGLRKALEDEPTKNCLRVFFSSKVESFYQQALDELKKPEPNFILAAKYSEVADTCSRMLSEMEYLVKV